MGWSQHVVSFISAICREDSIPILNRMKIKTHTKIIVSLTFIFALSVIVMTACSRCSVTENVALTEFDNDLEFEEEPEVKEPVVIKEPVALNQKKIVRYFDQLRYVKTVVCYATCYSPISDPDYKGRYANDDLDLPRHMRRAKTSDWTVALNLKMREYHDTLYQKQNGEKTHKYRFHVEGYNKENIDENKTDTEYFSIPKDCMTHATGIKKGREKGLNGECLYCKQNRIDVFFTTAGNYNSIEQRQNAWKRKNTHNSRVEIWEWKKIAVWSDGTKGEE